MPLRFCRIENAGFNFAYPQYTIFFLIREDNFNEKLLLTDFYAIIIVSKNKRATAHKGLT